MPKGSSREENRRVFVTNPVTVGSLTIGTVKIQDGAGTDLTSTLVGADQALDVNVVQTTGGGSVTTPLSDIEILLEISAEDIGSGQYTNTMTFAADAIVDMMVLYITPGGTCDSQITLEDDDSGALYLDIQLNNNTSVVCTDMNIMMDPSKSLTLTVGTSSGCTLNGFLINRT